MLQKFYKIIFWTGYTAVLVISLMNLPGALDKIKLNMVVFRLRLDHLLHFAAYLIICMYFLAGQVKGLNLFRHHQLRRFIVAVVTLAVVTEMLQIGIPSRSFNVADIVSNVAGIGIGVVIIKIEDRRLRRPGDQQT